MWAPFEDKENLFMIKASLEEDKMTVHVTNFKEIWSQTLGKGAVLERYAEMNPLIDTKLEDAVGEVLNLINTGNQKSVEFSEDILELSIVATLEGNYSVKFRLELSKTPDKFLTEVTVPLIQTVKYLEDRQNMLCNLIQKKDRELEEYQLEKGQISRQDLVTDKFDEASLNQLDDKTMLNVFGREDHFWKAFVRKHGTIQSSIEEVRKNPWNHVQRKRKVYSSKTSMKKGKGIDYSKSNNSV